jgi:formylglycine-generating enzyme required for sulfatase activity
MLPVTGGSFTSGSSTVTVSGFTMSATEITQAQYKAVTGDSPSYFSTVTGGPVEGRPSAYTITGRSPATGYPITSATVTMDKTKNGYRLPTDAEWEFTAQGGTKTKSYTYSGSNDVGTVAWYSSNASSTTILWGLKHPMNSAYLT